MILLCLLLFILLLFCALRKSGRGLEDTALTGLWRQTAAEGLVGYLYFSREGAVYYMASRVPVKEEMFTEKFRLSDDHTGRSFARWRYSLRERACGGFLLTVFGEAIGGTYYKIS